MGIRYIIKKETKTIKTQNLWWKAPKKCRKSRWKHKVVHLIWTRHTDTWCNMIQILKKCEVVSFCKTNTLGIALIKGQRFWGPALFKGNMEERSCSFSSIDVSIRVIRFLCKYGNVLMWFLRCVLVMLFSYRKIILFVYSTKMFCKNL